jgi:hypothetical protein
MKFNINSIVRIQLTDVGRDVLRRQWDERHSQYPDVFRVYKGKDEDSEGYSEWQLWQLFETFGDYVYLGARLPFETEIEIVE